jgi:ferrochelatase
LTDYDAILLVSFGGPEKQADVIPFLENVLRGKDVPHERLVEVSHHYEQFGGVSPLNDQNRALLAALEAELAANEIDLPVYWGNRNWHPLLPATFKQMHADGVRRVLAIFTSAYGSYSSCRQYQEDIARALDETGITDMQVDKVRFFFNHPGFIEANADNVQGALAQLPAARRDKVHLVFTAHSIPLRMADAGPYVEQLEEAARLVAEAVGVADWALVYQSRSGPPHQPWLEPDICDYLETVHKRGVRDVVNMPIGFISDHMEVIFDLDTEAQETAEELGMNWVRAATVGTHPRFVETLRELIVERTTGTDERRTVGKLPAAPDVCPADCCLMTISNTNQEREATS